MSKTSQQRNELLRGAVGALIPRNEFPPPLRDDPKPRYYQEFPYLGVDAYTLWIVPSGDVKTVLGVSDVMSYGFLWSGLTGILYDWADYYVGEFGRRTTPVGREKVFVEGLPDKDYRDPVTVVNVFASTAGVAYLALRSLPSVVSLWPILSEPGGLVRSLTELDDAPFDVYIDRLYDVEGLTDEFRKEVRERLELFFGGGG